MATFMLPEAKNTIHVSTNGKPTTVAPTVASASTIEGTAKSDHAQKRYILAAYILVVGAALLGWGLDDWVHPTAPIAVQGIGVFAALYVQPRKRSSELLNRSLNGQGSR